MITTFVTHDDIAKFAAGSESELKESLLVLSGKKLMVKVIELDKDRHETHLQLLEMGHKLGKDQGDVLIDLIRQQRTLEEYGLPEFSILTEEDVLMGDDWHQSYYFNVDTVACLPNEGDKIGWDGNENEDKSLLSKDQFMLVFSIVPIENYGEDELEPDDYAVRLKRAKAFAENMGGKIFEQRDSSYHEASAKILGVIFPKKDVEKIAGTIRDNPEKFRLGKEFYSSEELSLLKNEENE